METARPMETALPNATDDTPSAPAERDWLSPIVATLFLCFLLCLARGGWPAAQAAGSHVLLDRIDPNRAAWSDLTLLPGVGPVKASAIVKHREQAQEARAFTNAADLQAVPGIGVKTVRRIAPYLRFE